MKLQESITLTRTPILDGTLINWERILQKKKRTYTDFDKTMIVEDSILKCLKVCLSESSDRFKFARELIRGYRAYRKNLDIQEVYKLFIGSSTNVLEQVTASLHINDEWMKLTERLGLPEMTILSRNMGEFIAKYVREQFLPVRVESIVANYPEVDRGHYTGRIIPIVSNENLARLVKEDIYICGEDEKRILEKADLHPKSVKEKGLFIYEKR
jgi:hypothetical protein